MIIYSDNPKKPLDGGRPIEPLIDLGLYESVTCGSKAGGKSRRRSVAENSLGELLKEANVLAKNITPSLPEIIYGNGIKVSDKDGNEYLDLASQTCNLNLGHNHPIIIDAIREALERKIPYFVSSRFENSLLVELAEKFIGTAPAGLSKVNSKLCNGSDANEDAFKRARKYHVDKDDRRNMIISQYGSHHGESSETLSASGKRFPKRSYSYQGGSDNFLYVEPCNLYRKPKNISEEKYIKKCVERLEDLVEKRDDIAGLIIELIQVDNGVIPQPKEYIKKIEEICNGNDITFIVDEVQTAFGWCGKIFTSEDYNIRPDIITIGKALTSGFGAMAATIFRENLDNLDYGESEYTNGGQPFPCIAALANINYLQTSGILDIIKEKHNHFMSHLQKKKDNHKQIKDVRSYGLIFGIEFGKDDGSEDSEAADLVYKTAINNKLILRKTTCNGKNNVLLIKPPITITHDEIGHSMNIFNKILNECLK